MGVLTISYNTVATEVYRLTANAARERGEQLHIATEDNELMVYRFIEEGGNALANAFGRYLEEAMIATTSMTIDYAMPTGWKWNEEVKEAAEMFLTNYAIAKWYEMAGTGERFLKAADAAIVCVKNLLDKRIKPVR